MTCKDCIHYDVCMYQNSQIPLYDEFHYETDHVEDIGCPFIDKSNIQEVEHGKWEYVPDKGCWVCFNCAFESASYTKYCPNCGAKMEGVE